MGNVDIYSSRCNCYSNWNEVLWQKYVRYKGGKIGKREVRVDDFIFSDRHTHTHKQTRSDTRTFSDILFVDYVGKLLVTSMASSYHADCLNWKWINNTPLKISFVKKNNKNQWHLIFTSSTSLTRQGGRLAYPSWHPCKHAVSQISVWEFDIVRRTEVWVTTPEQ